jgi:hypothetical protein
MQPARDQNHLPQPGIIYLNPGEEDRLLASGVELIRTGSPEIRLSAPRYGSTAFTLVSGHV